VQLLRQLVSLGDLLRFKLLWWRIKRHGGILICDRYFYDLGISALYRQTMSPWTVNVIWKNAPRPDLAFFLDVIPEMAQQREGEHPVDYYIEKRRLYLNVMSTWPMVMLPSATIAQIQTQIETALEEQVVMAI